MAAVLLGLVLTASACGIETYDGSLPPDVSVASTIAPDVDDVDSRESEAIDEPERSGEEGQALAAVPAQQLPARLSVQNLGDVSGATIVLVPRPAVGETWSGSVTTDIGFDDSSGLFGVAPIIELGMDVEVIESSGEGMTVISEYTSIDVLNADAIGQEAVQQVRLSTGSMIGLRLRIETGTFGEAVATTIENPDAVDAGLLDLLDAAFEQMEELMPPVPTEAFGVGAQWSDTVSSDVDGVSTTVTYEYTLVDIDGDRYTLDSSYTQLVDTRQSVMELTGNGTLIGDVTEPMPLDSWVEATGEMRLVPAGRVDMHLNISIRGE